MLNCLIPINIMLIIVTLYVYESVHNCVLPTSCHLSHATYTPHSDSAHIHNSSCSSSDGHVTQLIWRTRDPALLAERFLFRILHHKKSFYPFFITAMIVLYLLSEGTCQRNHIIAMLICLSMAEHQIIDMFIRLPLAEHQIIAMFVPLPLAEHQIIAIR